MRITIIGSGNVATHLAAAFKNAGHRIVQVYSRNMQHAALLAYHVKAEPLDDLIQIDPETDIFVIAVKDDAIGIMAEQLEPHQKLMVHTSGATDLYALLAFADNVGVFYPLQTFSKTREVNFRNVPICIEAADKNIAKELRELAQTVSNSVYDIDSKQRRILHLAAVFANNFPNYLYTMAQQILTQQGLDIDLIRPLILETAEKVQTGLPAAMQTGPAIRHDQNTMDNHLQLLQDNPDLQQLYTLLSQGIIKMDIDPHGDK
ncbi:DUF2520 domain-containing protein [Mucilaginibacter corticis]|uniref:DUF2520 domain-containing protein n=1 Tax=Mucilaginibacter corticis TaxID=2597670 RepID=A0A556MHZ7_9SPHI|nr:Rossmann-like and DUF2520 domain-containing protein [Mucilaginibacter corticis]TSJ39483.1 DUF2520 domain-containing protein [Mucilaginibacter corticis]